MIPNDALTNALRSLGFTFKRQGERVMIWKKRGTTQRAEIRRIDLHDDAVARSILLRAGMPAVEVDAFIAQYGRKH